MNTSTEYANLIFQFIISLFFLHITSCMVICIFFLSGQFTLYPKESDAVQSDIYIEVTNFIIYTFSTLGNGVSVPSDMIGYLFTCILIITGLLSFSYFVAKIQKYADDNLGYSDYLQLRANLLETWMAQIERNSRGGNSQVLDIVKSYYSLYYKLGTTELFGNPFFWQLSHSKRQFIIDGLTDKFSKKFSCFFKAVPQRYWSEIVVNLKYRS